MPAMLLCFLDYAAFLDAGFLAGELAQVVKFRTAYFAVFVHCDRIDERRFEGEDTLHTDIVAHLADGEALLFAFACDFDHYAAVLLDTFLVAFLDTVCHGDGVAGSEILVLLAGGKRFLGNLN